MPDSGGGVGFAVTENALPDREMARSLAMATAAKIDAIESEMARDFLRPRKPGAAEPASPLPEAEEVSVEAAPPPVEPEEPPPLPMAAAPAGKPAAAQDESADPDREMLEGSINAIEVSDGNSSVLDETAILFANRQDEAAEGGLRAALTAEMLGSSTERGWLMLLELLQQRGDRSGFDQLGAQYFQRFGNAAPAWINYGDAAPRPSPARTGMPSVQLPEGIDAGIVKALEEFKQLAISHPALTLDVSATRYVDLVGAELLLRVFNAFKRASHELNVRGAEQLMLALRGAVEPGRRDPSDAAWMLLLEVQRLLDRQADFEETGIQYCITYEVSPPSWEPPPPNIRVTGGTEPASPRAADPLEWKGEIQGDGEAQFARLASAPREGNTITVECRQLRRMAFPAGTSMLGHLMRLAQGGVTVEFRNVNSLVAGLWNLLGISSLAQVSVRR